MSPEFWQKVDELYHSALQLEESRRAAFLEEACGGNEALKQEVESLLGHAGEDSFLATSAMGAIREAATPAGASILLSNESRAPGRDQLGRYRLIERIGAGGMGEVVLAHDPDLDRDIALKLLPAQLAGNSAARERLRREALAAAALDHPFICKVFEIGEDADVLFIAMEYVRGETLFDRLHAGRMPLAEALRIAREIADAMEEAHSANLIHRDLKPANIMVTSQGHVKIMDFGLVKRLQAGGQTTDYAEAQLTVEGMMVGTPDYMSPEQLRGAPLDGRSDLFAFGIILCELLTGKHPFKRVSVLDTVSSILRDPPSLSLSDSGELPAGLIVLIRRLLAKSPDERYSSFTELRSDLAELAISKTDGPQSDVQPALHLIGRHRERDQLVSHLTAALAGRGSFVLIGGEPGIGKTRLTRAILSEGRRRGCFGVVGHCYQLEGSPPYIPFIEMLEYCARVIPPASFRQSIGESAAAIAQLMPELRRVYPDIPPTISLPPEQQRRYLFNAYCEFVERSARLAPIVAVFEDLQWADEASLLLLRHLVHRLPTIPLLIIGTYRDIDLDITPPFAGELESWIRDRTATRLVLRALDLASVKAMLAALSGKEPPDSLASVIYGETDGNPFFVEEVFRHLDEEGCLFDETGAWRTGLQADELHVPRSVRLVIGRRLERLREETRDTLTMAAIVGRSFELRLLEALKGGQPDFALEAVEEAERAQLVEPDRRARQVRYRFVHELVRQALAEVISLPRRQRLHARIGECIERIYGDRVESQAALVAHHLYQAGTAADQEKTIEYLIRAARLAGAGAAHEEALANVDKAVLLNAGKQGRRAGELSLARAVALRSLSRTMESVEWYERAIESFIAAGDIPGAIDATFNLAYIHLWNVDGRRGSAVAERALRLIGTQPSPLLHVLLLLKSVSLGVKGDMGATAATLSAAKEVEAALPEPPRDGFSAMFEARTRCELAQFEEAERLGREAIVRFRAAGDVWGETEVFEPVIAALCLGRIREVEPLLRHAIPLAERIGHRAAVWIHRFYHAQMLMGLGDLEGAQRELLEARTLVAPNSAGWQYLDSLILGAIAYYRGQLDEAVQHLRRGLAIEPVTYKSGQFSGALFLALAAKGDPEAEAALAAARLDLPALGRPLSFGSCGCLALVLEGLAISGRFEEAADLLPRAESVVAHGPICVYSQHLLRTSAGIAAAAARDWARAEEHHRTAIRQADSAPYRPAEPIARYWYAEMLIGRGMRTDLDHARELLSEAWHLCEAVGMVWHAHRCKERLGTLGA